MHFDAISSEKRRSNRIDAARVMLNDAQTRTLHQFKTTVWIVRRR
jgi:hypothetical protein